MEISGQICSFSKSISHKTSIITTKIHLYPNMLNVRSMLFVDLNIHKSLRIFFNVTRMVQNIQRSSLTFMTNIWKYSLKRVVFFVYSLSHYHTIESINLSSQFNFHQIIQNLIGMRSNYALLVLSLNKFMKQNR